MRFRHLSDWLAWQEGLHPKAMDLGTERTAAVAARMGLDRLPFVLLTVGGTNGKGSCVALLASILGASGYRVGSFTSPHLQVYNERIRIDGAMAGDESLMSAFQAIDSARGEVSLTYFEFATLAAVTLFRDAPVEVAVMEVGLGGRLDAVNVLDADGALVTTVGIDHVQWLGPDREAIGREKAAIFRAHRPAVCGDPDPPESLVRYARDVGADLRCLGRDFGFEPVAGRWRWWGKGRAMSDLPLPGLAGAHQLRNAAAVLMLLDQLKERLRVSGHAVREGLKNATLAGRFQVIPGPVECIVDVAHNVQAAESLAEMLRARPCRGDTHAVVGMLADKDIGGVVAAIAPTVHAWYLAGLESPRSATPEQLAEVVRTSAPRAPVRLFPDVTSAYIAALEGAAPGDRVLVFGSFLTAGQVLARAMSQSSDAGHAPDRSAPGQRKVLGDDVTP